MGEQSKELISLMMIAAFGVAIVFRHIPAAICFCALIWCLVSEHKKAGGNA